MKGISKNTEKGFTIVELMIATVVLSVILLLVTTVVISISNLFYKGVNESKIQDLVRNTTDDIYKQLQLSGITPQHVSNVPEGTPAVYVAMYCLGNVRYTYVLNQELSNSANGFKHVLWRDTSNAGCTQAAVPDLTLNAPTAGGEELMIDRSRLALFCIGDLLPGPQCKVQTSSPWNIEMIAAYGDNDQFNNLTQPSISCKGGVGDQFCSTASAIKIVGNRIPSATE